MIFMTMEKHEIHVLAPNALAGKECNETSIVQVREDGRIVKQFELSVEGSGFEETVVKAVEFCVNKQEKEGVKA